jgi:hypothetical protein
MQTVLNQVYEDNMLGPIASLTRSTPRCVVKSDSWQRIVISTKEALVNLCRALEGKRHCSALYGTYTARLQDIQALPKSSKSKPIVTVGPSATTAESNGAAEVRG